MNPLFWLSYIVRSLRRGGTRSLFAMSCIAVGVAGVVALQIAASTIQNALTSNVRAANGGDISLTTEASPLSTSDLAVFRQLKQQGRISQWTPVASLHGTAVGDNRKLIPFDVNVVSSPPYPLGGQPTFVSPGNGNAQKLLSRPGDVLVTSVLANELGAGVGSRLLVNAIGGQGLHVTVRGVLAETSFEHSAIMTVQKRDSALLTNRKPEYRDVYINVPGSPDALARTLRAYFPAATVQTVSEALQQDEAQVHDFRQFLLMVGLLALLIAGIGTLNAIQSLLTRRRLEIAMLKAMGFGHGTLYALFGGEAVIIGLLGGLLGTLGGAVISKIVSNTLANALGLSVVFVVDPGTLASGIALGLGATLVFALMPIVRAAGFRPLELLREGVSGTALSRWPQTIGLVALVLILFALVAAVTLGDIGLAVELVVIASVVAGVLAGGFAAVVTWLSKLGPPRSRPLGLLVLAALLIASIFASRRLLPVAAILALVSLLWAFQVLLPESRRLPLLVAVRSLGRRRTRTSVTLVAFLAGVLAMSLTLTVAISLRNQINQALASSQSTNLVAIGDAGSGGSLARAGAHLPGTRNRTVMSIAQTEPVAVNGGPLPSVASGAGQDAGEAADERTRQVDGVTGFNLAAGAGPSNVTLREGRFLNASDAGTNHVMARTNLLDWPYFLQLGSRITLRETGSGHVATAQIIGFYSRSRSLRNIAAFFTPPIYSDQSFAEKLGGSDTQTVLAYSIDSSHLTADASTLQRAVPGALVIDIGDLAAIVNQILNELLDVLAVMTALLLGAGVAVVGNGVALAMLERRREIALYKAIGFAPRNVLTFVLTENALIGVLAGATSVLFVAIVLALLSRLTFQRVVGFDPGVAAIVLLASTGLAVVTAYLTARTPVRLRPLEALRNE